MSAHPRLLLATHNRDKIRELRELFDGLGLEEILSTVDVEAPEVDEDGDTLEANAIKKAREIAGATGYPCVADDTGLEVDALHGAPGVHSARYAGENCSYEDNCRKLLRELEAVPAAERTARFRTVMAFVDPIAGEVMSCEGVLEGRIAEEPRGDGGFGYDPIFELADGTRTLAELSLEEKNTISHRGRAAMAMRELLSVYLRSGARRHS